MTLNRSSLIIVPDHKELIWTENILFLRRILNPGLRHPSGSEGDAALGRAEAADRHRARARQEPLGPPPRRGHVRPRHGVGGRRAGKVAQRCEESIPKIKRSRDPKIKSILTG